MTNEENFFWWFEERLKYSKVKHSYYAWKNLDSAYRKLKVFRSEILVSEMNFKLIRDFDLYLTETGSGVNTIAECLSRVRIVVNEIVKCGIIEYHKNPFLHFKIQTQRTHKSRIPIEDIRKMECLDLFGQIEMVRDMYVFSFYCGGIRFGDLCRLKKSMIKEGHLHYVMNKTGRQRRIKLVPQALRFVFKREGEFVFDTRANWSRPEKSIGSRNAFFNRVLKRVCKTTGVIPLSFHTSRNSFADHAKKKRIDTHIIKDLLGHSKMKSTEVYMQDFYEEETGEAFSEMFG